MRLIKFFKNVISHILKGKTAYAMIAVAEQCPSWLVKFNKGWLMFTDTFIFPEMDEQNIKIKIAGEDDIEDIIRISGLLREYIENLMKNGAICFLAYYKDAPPVSLSWSISGRVFVRGMGFLHDYGEDGFYSFGSVTLPEARGKGLYRNLQAYKAKFETDIGAKKFYVMVEFTNTYSRSLREKLGYRTIINITFLKIFFFRLCRVKHVGDKKTSLRFFIKEPAGDSIII